MNPAKRTAFEALHQSKARRRRTLLATTFSLLGIVAAHADSTGSTPATATSSGFLFQDTARPVLFIGDDATAQRMFTTLIETYTLSRFPDWKITFRNTGWTGDKIRFAGIRASTGDQAIRRDIDSFHPQAVLVNYGLNDALGKDPSVDQFLAGVNILARDLPRVGVFRTAFISVIPKEGYEPDEPAGSKDNLTLQNFSSGMKDRFPIGWQNGVDFVRQHPKGKDLPQLQDGLFIDVFSPMRDMISAGRKSGVLSPADSSAEKTVRLMPDGIHPNWAGHSIHLLCQPTAHVFSLAPSPGE